jgi:uncharacterized protein involved in exopolysaccharide biosynthesis
VSSVNNIPMPSIVQPVAQANWVINAMLLWSHRHTLARVAGAMLVLGTVIAFIMPKRYESVARLMPPDQPVSGAAMLAAVTGRSLGGLGSFGNLAGNLFGSKATSALFIDLLHSRTISDTIIDRFNLQHTYGKRYRIDTVKYLARHTAIEDDKKSGVISLTFTDTDPQRTRAIAQAYIDELNGIVTRSNTSSARREREFIERRLVDVQRELRDAEKALSEFSSVNATLDIKEQTQAMVNASATLQAEIIVGRSELGSLKQIYGDGNVRVRATQARIATLERELTKMSGSGTASSADSNNKLTGDIESLYPSLRQLPRLAVPYADLYRRVRIQETVFELLSQQYEMARIEEAKDTPVVSVIDPPLVAEKKSFPPRLLIILLLTILSVAAASAFILIRDQCRRLSDNDPRKLLAQQMAASLHTGMRWFIPLWRGTR